MTSTENAARVIADFCRNNVRARSARPLGAGEIAMVAFLYDEDVEHTSVEVASRFNVSKPAVSKVVESLEKRGLLVKERTLKDKRAFILRLTEEGRNLAKDIGDEFERSASILRERIGKEEFDHFIEVMEIANGIIDEELAR